MSEFAQAVFISYASQDAAVAHALVEALEKEGLACWIAPRDVVPGSLYADAIVSAINDAQVVCLILSEHAVQSPHVGKEIERASSKGRRIIAVRTDSAPLTRAFEYFLSESQWIDLAPGDADAVAAILVEAVRRHLDPSATLVPASRAGLGVGKRVKGSSPAYRLAVGSGVLLSFALAYLVVGKFRLPSPWIPDKPAAAAARVVTDKSIAVLPFSDMSESRDQEYFADGMAQEVLDLLAKVPGVRVIGRTSSFQFKGRSEDLRHIGAVLGAAYVVEGSVRKSGNKLRVTAQLVDVRDGSHLWSETYDESLGDVLQVQERIAAGLVRALQVTIGADELRSRVTLRDLDGYNLYLRGRRAIDRGDKEGFQEAVDYFNQALALDPGSGHVQGWLATAHLNLAVIGYSTQRSFTDAKRSAERARALDSRSELAAGVLGQIHAIHDWDWAAAQTELDLALSLAPGNAQILQWHSVLPAALGHWEDSLRDLHASIALDPLAPIAQFWLGRTEMRRGDWNAAEAALRRALQIAPNSGFLHFYLAGAFLGRGDADGALREFALERDEEGRLVGRAAALHALGRHTESDAAMRRLTALAAHDWPYGLACAHAARGEHAAALGWLDKAYAARGEDLWAIKGDVFLRSLNGDPRYHAFLRKMNLPE